MKKFKFLILPVLLLNCQGNLESIDQGAVNSLYDIWIHKDFYSAIDSVVTKYIFSYPNELKIEEYIYYSPTFHDTSDYIGTFHNLAPNLLYQSLEYRLTQGDTIEYEDNALDTIIYQIKDDELHLCVHGNSYNQISGQKGIISNSTFYKIIRFPNNNYSHDLYRFSTDTMYHSFTVTSTPEIPQTWENNYTYQYYIKGIYIIFESGNSTYSKGYKFYKGKLIISIYPNIYKRYH